MLLRTPRQSVEPRGRASNPTAERLTPRRSVKPHGGASNSVGKGSEHWQNWLRAPAKKAPLKYLTRKNVFVFVKIALSCCKNVEILQQNKLKLSTYLFLYCKLQTLHFTINFLKILLPCFINENQKYII